MKSSMYGISSVYPPPRIPDTNEGLKGFPTKNGNNPGGDCYWVGDSSTAYLSFLHLLII